MTGWFDVAFGAIMLLFMAVGVVIVINEHRKKFGRRYVSGDMVGRNSSMATVVINGRTFTNIAGRNVTIRNDRVIIDGKDVTDEYQEGLPRVVEIRILEGTIQNLTTDASVTCNDVTGNVDAGGSVSCKNVGGDVDSGGSTNCGAVQGSVDAGGSVNCGRVGGSVDAGGSVRHG